MEETGGTTISSETRHEGRVLTVTSDRVRLPHGRETTLDVVRHRPSVILLPMPDSGQIVLVRQYRYAVDRWIWELPAGNTEPGEPPEEAARRECEEEIGQAPGRVERIGAFYPTPGYCDEEMIFFRLTQLTTPDAPALPDDDELLEPHKFSLADARRMVAEGDIIDMKTALGLTLI